MTLDPRADIRASGLTGEAALQARIAQLQRTIDQLTGGSGSGAAPSVMAAYDEEMATVSTNSAAFQDLGGPSIDLWVPSGGGFVWLYAELEGRDTNNTGSPARAGIHEATDFPAVSQSYIDFNVAAFQIRRLLPILSVNASATTFGSFVVYRASGGKRTYSLRYSHTLANLAEFRNRRLWGRVSQ